MDTSPIRVLHVDDDPSLLELTGEFLEREDDRLVLETATSADEGLDQIGDRPPDCIVSDYDMPGKNGIEFLQTVRKTRPDLPFILFTGKGSESVASDAIVAGVTDYLQKGSGTEQYELLANRITNAVQAQRETERADRQEQLMRLTEFAGDTGGFELDVDSGDLLLTDGARRLVGLPDDTDLTLEEAIELYHPDDQTDVRRTVSQAAEAGEQTRSTWRLQTLNGGQRLVDVTITPATENSDVTTLRGSIHDITERRERQQELEQVETLFEHAQDSLFLIDIDGEFTVERVNPAYEAATGRSADQLRGRTPQEILGEQQGAIAERRYRDCVERREPLEYTEQLRFDGELTQWETRIAPVVLDSSVKYIVGATRDVAEREERQRELRLLQQAINDADTGITLSDPSQDDNPLVYVNDAYEELTGYSAEETLGRNCRYLQGEDTEPERVAALRDAINEEEPVTVELRNYRKDGTEFWNRLTVTPIYDDDGTLVRYLGTQQDATERKERERRLTRTKALLSDMAQLADVGAWEYDPETGEPTNTAGTKRIYGVDPGVELTLAEGFEFFHPDDRDRLRSRFEACLESGEPYEMDVRIITAEGEQKWVTVRGERVNETGHNSIIRGYIQDITEQKERERQLDAEREFTEQALNALDDLFYVFDMDGVLQRWNEQVVEVTGYDPAELDGLPATELFPDDEQQTIADGVETTLKDGRAIVEADLLTADDETIPYEFTGARLTDVDGQTTGLVGIGRNLTERRQRERRFQALVEESSDLITIVDSAGVYRYQSPSIERVLGYDPEETIGDTAWEYVHPDDRAHLIEAFERGVVDPDANPVTEYRARHADGSWRWLEARGNNQLDNPAVEGYIINSRDVTERKERERELRQLKEEYQSVVENVQDSLFLWEVAGDAPDHEFELRWINPANASQLGVSAETVQGKTPTEIFGEETGRQVIDNYERSIGRGETVSYEERLDMAGEARQFETTVTPVDVDGEVTQIVGVAHDITERLERERELERQNERLNEFASIVSHDLRSPLTVAEGHLELAQEACESDHLVQAADAVGRSQALIEDLLTLAQEGEDVSGIESVELADVAENTWQTVEAAHATLEIHTTQVIQADQSRLKQLLENLFGNAVEHGGDDVTVSVGETDGGFYVADTGPGIPKSDREEIFEAGYSATEEGTGFGLRIATQIAEAHGWEIAVLESEQGGARFEITGTERME